MGTTNYGNQVISVDFKDPANSSIVNKRHFKIRELGIYKGGLLTKISDTSVSVSPLVCEITDGTHQVRISTENAVTLSVNSSTPYIVLRWAYVESETNYMDILAVAEGDVQSNDLIVGVCKYTGVTLNGFDYSKRLLPYRLDLYLKVEPTSPASMRLHIRAGILTLKKSYFIEEQDTGVFVAPSSDKRIDFIYIDKDGTIKVSTGVESANPQPNNMAGKIVLALVNLYAGMTEIKEEDIVDARSFIGSSLGNSLNVGIDVKQTGHGFSVGDVVCHNGTSYIKQVIDTMDKAKEVVGVVSEVQDADNFTVTVSGYVDTLSGLTAGETYYVSNTTQGSVVATEPEISRPILYAIGNDTAYILQVRPLRKSAFETAKIVKPFTNGDLTNGKVTATHNFGRKYVNVTVYDDANLMVIPDEVKLVDDNNVEIDMSSYVPINGTYNLVIIG